MLNISFAQSATHSDLIALMNPVAGMRQPICQFPIVCEQQEPRRFNIKPSYWVETGTRRMQDQIDRPAAPFRITVGADRTSGLEKHHIDISSGLSNNAAFSHDAIVFCIDPGWQCGDNLTVDGDHP